tara:strand:+ start:549 stop:821 length:273 start_codon:yes stop_codon:yes gene_type:complete
LDAFSRPKPRPSYLPLAILQYPEFGIADASPMGCILASEQLAVLVCLLRASCGKYLNCFRSIGCAFADWGGMSFDINLIWGELSELKCGD